MNSKYVLPVISFWFEKTWIFLLNYSSWAWKITKNFPKPHFDNPTDDLVRITFYQQEPYS